MTPAFSITNAKIILPDTVIPHSTIVVKGKKIGAICKGTAAPPDGAGGAKINARGNFVAPGFIDLHIHGDVRRISQQQVKGGTTGFLATLHPARPQALLEDIVQTLIQSETVLGARVLGTRLEGPFLNRRFCGALAPRTLRQPDINEAQRIIKQAAGSLRLVVLAPELKGAARLIALFKRHNIISSLGHSGASYEQALQGIEAGVSHATHTFNRMRGFDQRDPGALGAALIDKRVSCEVIADGIHVHPANLQLLLNSKGVDKVLLITDSTAAQQEPHKRRQGLVFKLKDGTLYGTALTLNIALQNAVKFLGLSIPEAVRLVSLNPAKLLRIDSRKGSLAVGKDADIVIFNRNFNVKMTIVEGKIVFNRLSTLTTIY